MVANMHLNSNGKTFCERLVQGTPVFDSNSSILLSNERMQYWLLRALWLHTQPLHMTLHRVLKLFHNPEFQEAVTKIRRCSWRTQKQWHNGAQDAPMVFLNGRKDQQKVVKTQRSLANSFFFFRGYRASASCFWKHQGGSRLWSWSDTSCTVEVKNFEPFFRLTQASDSQSLKRVFWHENWCSSKLWRSCWASPQVLHFTWNTLGNASSKCTSRLRFSTDTHR